MARYRQASVIAICAVLCAFGMGCAPRDVGVAERCAELMRRAYPSAAIEITKSTASATNLTTIVAEAEGVRGDLPPDAPVTRILAIECRFDENVLTGFRWTAGPH